MKQKLKQWGVEMSNTFAREQNKPAENAVSKYNPEVKANYLEALSYVERAHRSLLDVIKDEFERSGRSDVNPVQALILFHMGDSELTAGELKTRGYYLGSNVSYNLKKLVELGYVHHQRSRVDRRAVKIKLTEKGQEIRNMVDKLYDRHSASVEVVGGIAISDFQQITQTLQRLERYWVDQIRYRL
jgi:DNA-binding MarR family transcriptional regulator